MVRALLTVTAVVVFNVSAWAACPPGTRYDCQTTYNGKQSCGCR